MQAGLQSLEMIASVAVADGIGSVLQHQEGGVADALAAFLRTDGTVDPWLADQLLLPLALADGPSELRTSEVTAHLLTNAEVIRLFLAVEIDVDGPFGGPATVQVRPGSAGLKREMEEPCSAGT